MVKLLVVDDSKVVTNLVKKYLEDQNFDLTILYSGEEALTFLKQNAVDLVLLDVVMEGLSGFETMEQLNTMQDVQAPPVIFITSMDRGDDINKGFALGAIDYIIKPFTKFELQDKIKNSLSNIKKA